MVVNVGDREEMKRLLGKSGTRENRKPEDTAVLDGSGKDAQFHDYGRMAALLRSLIRNRNLARNHHLDLGTHALLHGRHEKLTVYQDAISFVVWV